MFLSLSPLSLSIINNSMSSYVTSVHKNICKSNITLHICVCEDIKTRHVNNFTCKSQQLSGRTYPKYPFESSNPTHNTEWIYPTIQS